MEKERQVVGRCQKHRKYRALEAEGDENQRKYRVVELEKVKTPGKKHVFLCWKCCSTGKGEKFREEACFLWWKVKKHGK